MEYVTSENSDVWACPLFHADGNSKDGNIFVYNYVSFVDHGNAMIYTDET